MRVHEIYKSISGESTRAGWPCIVVRLSVCNLRCSWCDTPKALVRQESDIELEPMKIVEEVSKFGMTDPRYVLVTGGEPLLQKETPLLLDLLSTWVGDEGLVQLETSGSLPIGKVPPEVGVIMDIKCPASGEASRNLWRNLDMIAERGCADELKFVIATRSDYEWARQKLDSIDGTSFSWYRDTHIPWALALLRGMKA